MLTESRIRELEESIRYRQGTERALYIDKNGDVIFDSAKDTISDKRGVYTDPELDKKYAKICEVAIHSHPSFEYFKCYWGSSFSTNDIHNAMKSNFKEIRFCDKYWTGILSRKGASWKNIPPEKIEGELRDYKQYFLALLDDGKMKLSEYLRNYQHYCVENFALNHGLNYRRELRHRLPPVPDFRKTVTKKFLKEHPNVVLE